jgi:hypothetical protein
MFVVVKSGLYQLDIELVLWLNCSRAGGDFRGSVDPVFLRVIDLPVRQACNGCKAFILFPPPLEGGAL